MRTSSTRHPAREGSTWRRNSSAVAKISEGSPTDDRSRGSATRSDGSSSTTKTVGGPMTWLSVMRRDSLGTAKSIQPLHRRHHHDMTFQPTGRTAGPGAKEQQIPRRRTTSDKKTRYSVSL